MTFASAHIFVFFNIDASTVVAHMVKALVVDQKVRDQARLLTAFIKLYEL